MMVIDQGPEGDDRQAQSDAVQRGQVVQAGAGHEQPSADHGDHCHRDQRKEHRAPPEVLQQGPADHRSGGHTNAGNRAPGADGRSPGLAIGEGVGDDRQTWSGR